MLNAFKKMLFQVPRPPLEVQLATLRECGIKPITPEFGDLVLRRCSRNHARHEPYMDLLLELGGGSLNEDLDAPYVPLSNNIWHFDTECIMDHGDYAALAERLAALSQGALVLSDLRDHVDIEKGVAWLSFRLGEQSIRWDLTVNGDWVDSELFDRFAALLIQSGSERRYLWFRTDGQDCLVGCATPAEKERLERETGLQVSWG